MPQGFFHKSEVLASVAPVSTVPKCGACGLYKQCKTPKMEPAGKGRKSILIVGEAPGRMEDEKGVPFCGSDGKLLEKTLRKFGVDMRRDCHLTNAIICHPPKGELSKQKKEVDHCRPNLVRTIEEVQPESVILLGGGAVKSLIGQYWKAEVGQMARWHGWNIPCRELNAWLSPTFHPLQVLRTADREPLHGVLFEKHIKHALELTGRPWEKVPNVQQRVERIYDPNQAADILRKMREHVAPICFDYETNMIKPDPDDALVVSCAVSWKGKKTIAYPWLGPAIQATQELLEADHPKVGANIKFEQRWTMKALGVRVRNWLWDSMNGAHVLDYRPDITSVKFQSFVLLGAESYDDVVKPLLKAKKGSTVNQILEEIDLPRLLLYNGIDAQVEYDMAKIQMRQINHPKWKLL